MRRLLWEGSKYSKLARSRDLEENATELATDSLLKLDTQQDAGFAKFSALDCLDFGPFVPQGRPSVGQVQRQPLSAHFPSLLTSFDFAFGKAIAVENKQFRLN